MLIEPGLLLMRIVPRHERSEPVRADVARHDQEIASRDRRQKPVLIAQRDDPHVVNSPHQSLIVGGEVKAQSADRSVFRISPCSLTTTDVPPHPPGSPGPHADTVLSPNVGRVMPHLGMGR